jgi:hypothetical protein
MLSPSGSRKPVGGAALNASVKDDTPQAHLMMRLDVSSKSLNIMSSNKHFYGSVARALVKRYR